MSPGSDISLHLAEELRRLPSDSELALIFPGQGSQKVGMGKDVIEHSASTRAVFDLADRALEIGLSELCFAGPEEELTRTVNAQPAILATSIALLAAAIECGALQRRPAFLAGHSLGEYTALVAAGSLEYTQSLRLVRQRGHLMEAAAEQRPATMAAVVGLDATAVAEICDRSGAEPSNYNSPTQIVIGGAEEAVRAACVMAKERGGKGLPLNVSGAFHTSLMKPAARQFAAFLRTAEVRDPSIPVVSNVTSEPLLSAGDVIADLEQQVTRPVLWYQSIDHMAAAGVRRFIEVGPGRVLTQLLKRSFPGLGSSAIDGAAALASPSYV